MDLLIIDLIKNYPADITYIAIGSAFLRDTEPHNMQQFPPFLQDIYNNTTYSIRIINIDINFETPYLLPSFMSDLHPESEHIFSKTRLQCIYYKIMLECKKTDDGIDGITFLDEINKIIMNQSNILIVGEYTGEPSSLKDNIFKQRYKDTIYELLYKDKICYDFTNDGYGGCHCNVLENYPIFNLESKKIIKLNIIEDNSLIETFLTNIDNEIITNKIKLIVVNNFKAFINKNHYVFRNLKNKNLHSSVLAMIQNSIFINIDITNYTTNEVIQIFKNELNCYKQYIEINFNNIYQDFVYLIDIIEIYDDYEWSKDFNLLANKIENYSI
jgi:hypothetical protein